ncbi:MAG: flagellar basal body rod protein FlgC [Candidatus Brocadiia bacterium]
MQGEQLFRAFDISASGLHAEWVRLQVVANNVANAETTQTPEGGPYRRQHVVFSTVLEGLNGVRVEGVVPSDDAPRMVYNPGHPHAGEDGFVAMPNVKVPLEMVDLLTASRAYEANLAAISNFKKLCQETLKLLR